MSKMLGFALAASMIFGSVALAGNKVQSSPLTQAITRSASSFKAYEASQKYPIDLKGSRLKVLSANGSTATAQIQSFGNMPGPVMMPQKKGWYGQFNATFKKAADGSWEKQGKWNALMYALDAQK